MSPALDPAVMRRHTIYVAGEWREPAPRAALPVIDPTTEDAVGEIVPAAVADVADAAAAADRAREEWAAAGFARRAQYLRAIAEGLGGRRELLVDLIITEVGTPRRIAGDMQVDVAIKVFGQVAEAIERLGGEEQVANSTVTRAPVGVAGLITPWNYPLYQIALKVAPALGAGCPVLLKPSEVAPLNAYVLTDVIHAAGLPRGVFNLLPGTGPTVGEAIVAEPRIDMVSFTGSVLAGRRVAALAGEGVKRVELELGGKGGAVVLAGGDLGAAVKHAVRSCYSNAGQTCAALTRLIVPRGKLAEAEEAARGIAANYVVGDPNDPKTELGPLVSAVQQARVQKYVAAGAVEGAKTVLGPADRKLPNRGFFVAPTIFSEVTPDMTIAREEIFGPVLSIMPAESDDAALAIANATPYGLTAAVWAADPSAGRRAAERIRAGSVTINGGKFNPGAPFGGFKQSGFGRERGRYGLEEYLTYKAYHG
jgi:aldehyde dehydrogenase (NAD+)